MRSRANAWTRVGGWVALAIALALFARALSGADLRSALRLVEVTGPRVLFVLAPFALLLAIDAVAFRSLFAALGRRVRYAPLLAVRFSSETVSISLPAGAIAAESMHPWLLARRCGIPAREAVAAIAGKRWLMMRAHGVYIAVAAVVGWSVFAPSRGASSTSPRGRHSFACSLLRAVAGTQARAVDDTDANLARLGKLDARAASATLLLLFGWFIEAGKRFSCSVFSARTSASSRRSRSKAASRSCAASASSRRPALH